MGQTISEKILARAAGKKAVAPGEIIYVKPDLVSIYDWPGFDALARDIRIDPKKIVVNFDHFFMAHNELEAKTHQNFRNTSAKYGIAALYDVGGGGIGFHLLAEKGHVKPGMMIVHVDPHVSTFGAFGAYAIGVGGDIMAVFQLGEVWLKVPGTIKCVVKGHFQKGVASRDLFEYILRDLGPAGAIDSVFEFSGPAIADMSMESRMVLCNSVQYLSAETAIIPPDDVTLEWLKRHTKDALEPVLGDPDATYSRAIEYDVSRIEPQVVEPPDVYNVRSVSEVAGRPINQVFIGSCASARMEDLRLVAKIWKGKKVHHGVRTLVIPVTQQVYQQAAEEGLVATFAAAGAVVGPPSCGPCYGGFGTLLPGETCLATSTLNISGRMGSSDAFVYLSSPATAAASALEGKITDPRSYL